jgi:hypothetical protein
MGRAREIQKHRARHAQDCRGDRKSNCNQIRFGVFANDKGVAVHP